MCRPVHIVQITIKTKYYVSLARSARHNKNILNIIVCLSFLIDNGYILIGAKVYFVINALFIYYLQDTLKLVDSYLHYILISFLLQSNTLMWITVTTQWISSYRCSMNLFTNGIVKKDNLIYKQYANIIYTVPRSSSCDQIRHHCPLLANI